MDLAKVLAQLHAELDNINAAILSLESLQREGARRGRPPKVLAEIRRKIRTGRGKEDTDTAAGDGGEAG